MRLTTLMLIGALCATGSTSARAQDTVSKGLNFAIGTCFMTLDNLERVRSSARVLKWEPMSGDEQNMIRPVEAGPGFAAWKVNEGGSVALVSINTGTLNGAKANVCTVAVDLKPSELLPPLKSALKLRLLKAEVVATQRIEQYAAYHPTQHEVLVTVMYLDEKQAPTIVSFVGRP